MNEKVFIAYVIIAKVEDPYTIYCDTAGDGIFFLDKEDAENELWQLEERNLIPEDAYKVMKVRMQCLNKL